MLSFLTLEDCLELGVVCDTPFEARPGRRVDTVVAFAAYPGQKSHPIRCK